MSKSKRIRELMEDEGMSRSEARAWAEFEHDYKPTQSELKRLIAEVDAYPGCAREARR